MFHAKLCTALDKFKTLFVKYRISKWEQMWLRSKPVSRMPISKGDNPYGCTSVLVT